MVAVQVVVAELIGTAVAIKVGAAALGVHAVSQGKKRERTRMVRGRTVGQQGQFLVVDDVLSTSPPSRDNLFIVLGPCLTN
jgi:orotate phosphoribosyltransferase